MISSITDFLNQRVSMLFVHPFALVIPFILFLFFLYKFSFPSHGKNLPPSPPKLPIIGNLHQIGANPHRSLKALSQRYGELMLLHFGSKQTLIISSKEMASQVLKTFDASFSGRPKLSVTKTIFYSPKDLIFGPYGEHWRNMRSISMLHLFTNKRVTSFGRVREEEVALMVEKIKKSSVLDLSKLFFTLTNDLICRAAFGRKYSQEGGFDFEMMIDELARLVGTPNIEDVIPWMAWINRFNGVNGTINKLGKGFDYIFEGIMKEHSDRAKESTAHDSESMKDFVDILLEVQRSNPTSSSTLDNEAIKGLLLDMFGAGTHTGFVTLEWTFTELIRHPRVMKRLQEEVRRVVGDKEAVTEEDLEKMSYMKAVIKESFRFHPALPLLLPRECTADVKLNGYDIPAGTQVIINAWAIARDPKYWEEPEKFVPERFLDSAIDFKGQHPQLIPFGGGRRGCPGISLSLAGIELALANLVYRFDWGLPDGAKSESVDVSETIGSISHKKVPLIVVATPWMAKKKA